MYHILWVWLSPLIYTLHLITDINEIESLRQRRDSNTFVVRLIHIISQIFIKFSEDKEKATNAVRLGILENDYV